MESKINELILTMAVFSAAFFTITCQFKGILYDDERKKADLTYKGNKSFSSRYRKLFFSIPFPVKVKSDNELLRKRSIQYNIHAILFWISMMIILYFQVLLK